MPRGRCWAVSYCLTWDLTHLGPSGTRQTNNTFSHTSTLLSCSIGSVFLFSFFCSGYFELDPRRALPVPPEADCALPSASRWLSGPDEPAGACGQSFFQSFPSCRPLDSVVKLPRPAGGAGSLQDALDPDQVLMSGSSCWLTHQRRAMGDRDGEDGGFKGSFHKNRGAIICTVFGLDVFMYAH